MEDVGKNFRIKVSKVTDEPINEVTFIVGDVKTSFSNFNGLRERSIYITVPEESGIFGVIVVFKNGKEIVLSGNEYRAGLGVYISVSDSDINYTKAHW
jgi:hypothetical protein